MKHFINKLLFIAIFTALTASSITSFNATETRVGSMGGVGFFTKDNSNIVYFPGTINFYPQQIVAKKKKKNSDNSYTIGGHLSFNETNVLGIYLNRPIAIEAPGGVFDNITLDRATDLYLGMPFSNFNFGGRISVGFDSYKQDSTAVQDKDHESARYINVGCGISSETIDMGGYFELPSAKSEENNNDEDKWSGMAFGGNVRAFMGNQVKIVPVGLLSISSTTYEHHDGALDSTTAKVDYSAMDIGLGIGINHNIKENSMVIIGVEVLGMNKDKTDIRDGNETTVTTTTMPGLYMGAESQINRWLTGRIGAAQVFQSTKTKVKPPTGDETETSVRSSQFKVTFGLAVEFGNFTLDLSFNEGLLFDGPNFISNTNETIADQLSITYNF